MTKMINIQAVRIKNNIQMDTKNQYMMNELQQDIQKLYRVRQLGKFEGSKEWKILIDSFLTSIIVINNILIMA